MKNILRKIAFSEIVFWDVKRYLQEKIESKYPIRPLHNYISERIEKVKPSEHPNKKFQILGVNNKIGIFDSYIKKGKDIKQSYKLIYNNDLAYNPYRVNVGSIGLKSENQKHQFISPAYVVFYCREKLKSEFLYKVFKTDTFNQIINDNTTGSVRQNLKFNTLSNIKIPILPLEKQEELINNFNTKIEHSIEQELKANRLEQNIETYLFRVLGVKKEEKKLSKKKLNIVRFKDCDRWAINYLLSRDSISWLFKGKFPILKVKDFMFSYQYGISEKSTKEPTGTPMLRMNNIYKSQVVVEDLKYIILDGKNNEKFLLDKGDLLFNRTNSKELVGKTAVFEEEGKFTFASYLIRLKLDISKVNIHYINHLFNSQLGRIQIDMVSRQTLGQANINSKELQEFIFPIPPLKTQNYIANKINKIKTEMKLLQKQAEENRKNALKNLEKEVFML